MSSDQELRPEDQAGEELKEEQPVEQGDIPVTGAVDKEEELTQLNQRYLRLAADFENYRRRTSQEIEEIRRTAAERLLLGMLPLLDNFERAIASAQEHRPQQDFAGIEMIYRQLLDILSQEGVTQLKAVGEPFNPVYHEAFAQVETDEWPEGTVTMELRRGYLLRDKVLRPAFVQVAKSPDTEDPAK